MIMDRPFHFIDVDRREGVFCARLRQQNYSDNELEDLGAEIGRLVDEEGGRRLVLTLGPADPQLLFSVFLAKLINLQKRLEAGGGQLAIAQVGPATLAIFQVAGLERFFHFYSSEDEACAALQRHATA